MSTQDRNVDFLLQPAIAHRGLWNDKFPENSLGAFQNAINNGYAIELDVKLSKDGKAIVFHDNDLFRMTGQKGLIGDFDSVYISSLNLLGTSFKVPTLSETLKLVNGKVPLLIEIKDSRDRTSLVKTVINDLKDYKGKFAIQSFDPFVLCDFKKFAPEMIRGLLATFKYDNMPFVKRWILKHMILNVIAKPDFISYENRYMPNKVVDHCKNKAYCKAVIVWTIRSQQDADLAKAYADNIIFEHFLP